MVHVGEHTCRTSVYMKDVCASAICTCARMVHRHGCMHVLYTRYGHVSERFTEKFRTCIPQKLFTVVQPRQPLRFQPPKKLFQCRKCVSGVARDLLHLEWEGCKIGRSHDFPSCSIIHTPYSQYTASETCTHIFVTY